MGNLFSIFDPVTVFNTKLNWVSAFLTPCLFLPRIFWVRKSQIFWLCLKLLNYLHLEIKIALGEIPSLGHRHLILSLFLFIIINNFFGLTPYTFTATRHLVLTLTLALIVWITVTTGVILKDLGATLAHLVPTGTPYILIPLIVLIELVRNLIRPITLSVRLAANIVAGHLLLTLIGGASSLRVATIFVLFGLILIITLECAVALIQSYVFSTLSSLYVADVNSKNLN